jgi:hypothetical protein
LIAQNEVFGHSWSATSFGKEGVLVNPPYVILCSLTVTEDKKCVNGGCVGCPYLFTALPRGWLL